MSKGKKNGFFKKFLDWVEKVGNKLPHPVTIFVIFSLIVIIVSHLAAKAGVAVEYQMIDPSTKEAKMAKVAQSAC